MKCEMRWEDCDKPATRNYRRNGSDVVLTVCGEHAEYVRAMFRGAQYNSWEV